MACGLLPAVPRAQTLTTLYSFSGGSDGGHPYGSLIADGSGALYSTTFEDLGTVFKLTPPPPTGGPWIKSVLYNFTGRPDAQAPFSALIADASGTLYGTTPGGGTTPAGTIYKVTPPTTTGGAWTETVLYSFTNGSDGGQPDGALIADASGALYGTAPYGGASGNGVVFKLTPPTTAGGAWTETVLYSFNGGSDGTLPTGSLIADAAGALYGTTTSGGTGSSGIVFKLTPPTTAGGAWTETILYTFTGSPDGANPFVGLIADASGALYGATYNGGTSGNGTVFQLTPPITTGGAWTETVLHSFSGGDGVNPRGSLIADALGALYGTTFLGGTGNSGVVFKLTPPTAAGGAWTETVLYSFTGGGDGANPPCRPDGRCLGRPLWNDLCRRRRLRDRVQADVTGAVRWDTGQGKLPRPKYLFPRQDVRRRRRGCHGVGIPQRAGAARCRHVVLRELAVRARPQKPKRTFAPLCRLDQQ
jgi:uncharacterized repeat protein (TIGR03803 family)